MQYRYLILPVFVVALLAAGCTDPKKFVEERLVETWKPGPLASGPLTAPLQYMKSDISITKAEDGFFTGEGKHHFVLKEPVYRAVEEPDFDASLFWQRFEGLRADMAAANLPMPPGTERFTDGMSLVRQARADHPDIRLLAAVEALPVGTAVEFRAGISGVYDTKAKTVQVTSNFSPQMTPDLDAMQLYNQQGLRNLQVVPDEQAAVKEYQSQLEAAVEKVLASVEQAAATTRAKYEAARAVFAPGTKFAGPYSLGDRDIRVVLEVLSYDTKDDTFEAVFYDEGDPDFRKRYNGSWKRPRREGEIGGREVELKAAGGDGPLKSGLNTPALFEATSNTWEFEVDGSRLDGRLRNLMKGGQIKLERLES